MSTHVQVWSGSRTVRITDMTNAGKRGKTCARLVILGDTDAIIDYLCTTPEQRAARTIPYVLECRVVNENRTTTFAELVEAIRPLAVTDALPHLQTKLIEEPIRGIDAPKTPLTAGVAGLWSASADEDGIHIRALNDINEWTEITYKQTPAAAYSIARKVWPQVQQAATRIEASNILSEAGARLHGFCGMD